MFRNGFSEHFFIGVLKIMISVRVSNNSFNFPIDTNRIVKGFIHTQLFKHVYFFKTAHYHCKTNKCLLYPSECK